MGRRGRSTPRPLPGDRLIRRRFADAISRQLELFASDNAGLLDDVAAAERAYDRAPRDEAEERYGDFLHLVETGAEQLAELRDAFASTLDGTAAVEYEQAFNREARKRFPRFAVELDDP
jgi:hypothetical protein